MASREPIRYVPAKNKDPYRSVMNSVGVQRLLFNTVASIQNQCIAQGIDARRDVQPGKMRAHARVTATRRGAGTYDKRNFKNQGHNKRIDMVLANALDAARR